MSSSSPGPWGRGASIATSKCLARTALPAGSRQDRGRLNAPLHFPPSLRMRLRMGAAAQNSGGRSLQASRPWSGRLLGRVRYTQSTRRRADRCYYGGEFIKKAYPFARVCCCLGRLALQLQFIFLRSRFARRRQIRWQPVFGSLGIQLPLTTTNLGTSSRQASIPCRDAMERLVGTKRCKSKRG